MSYLVLARKYRPQTFDELIGQKHIVDILKSAVSHDRVAHAYLFCGPRGIGKTSCARILSMCLNAEGGPSLAPSADSFISREIAAGNSFDVIEIDGASNRGIDEIRTLRENVRLAPTYGRYKIYIIDEVHMLTTEAFNALLKTLEEPPEHVKFIFATTEAHKVPTTIVSRCQRFDFKRIPIKVMVEALESICQKEGVQIDPEALYAIAKAANGGMRDALSILDQLSALSDQHIKAENVFEMLGMVETQYLFNLTDHLIDGDCPSALQTFHQIIEQGKDIRQLGRDLTEHFRHVMVLKIGGGDVKAIQEMGKLVDYPAHIKKLLHDQSNRMELGGILEAIELLIEAQDVARIMETHRLPLEVAFARMTGGQGRDARLVVEQRLNTTVEPLRKKEPKAPSQKDSKSNSPSPALKNDDVRTNVKSASDSSSTEVSGEMTIAHIRSQWNALTHAVSKERMAMATYLQEGRPVRLQDDVLTIGFDVEHAFQRECIDEKDNLQLIEQIFSKVLGQKLAVKTGAMEAPQSDSDDKLDSALDMFGGEVVNEWHNDG